MRPWLWMLSGLIVWTIHFFGVYGLASIAPGTSLARVGAVVITVLCAGALLLLLRRALARRRQGDGFTQWRGELTLWGIALSLVAVLWQGLPAFI